MDTILSSLADICKDPVIKYVILPIKQQITYPFNYKTKVERLQEVSEQLKNKKDRLEKSVDDATRNGEEIFDNVTKWLIASGKAIEEAQQLVQDKEVAGKERCFVGLCPNLKTRYQLSKGADKKALAIDKLQNEDGLETVSKRPHLQQYVDPSVFTLEAFESRLSVLKQVMDALRDPTVNMVGVYGMGGVGKSTLAKEVQGLALKEKLFDDVVLVAVSQTPELGKIQRDIADVLGLKFDVEEMRLRASLLSNRMKEKKILLILDDIWEKLDLNELGIPTRDDCKGFKILLTSRNKALLSCEMGAQHVLELKLLEHNEACSLFAMTVARAKDPTFSAIANEIIKKCGGLPLLILLVATDLRGCQELYAWEDKLKQLSEFDNEEIYAKVHKILESSYEKLPSRDIKSFFLLCGLFGQSNIQIQYLLRYYIGMGLFKRKASVEEARNRVYRLIKDLQDCCLLLRGDMDGFVKMHDVVRDTALSIACKEQLAFTGVSGVGLTELPKKNCTRISLPYCDIQELPELECPEAELLLLLTEDLCLKIPDSIFKGVRKLKVLDFNGMRFGSLPSSLTFLTNLHTLFLHRCQLDKVSIIGELKQLEVLSFADSYIVELPKEIQQLTRLKILDLSNCSKLKVFPENVLAKLSLLEELYMGNSFAGWEAKGVNNQGNASLAELGGLRYLTTLELQVLDAEVAREWHWSGLRRYKIFIGDEWEWSWKYETSTTVKLKANRSIEKICYGINVLLRECGDLYLDKMNGIENVLFDLDGEGFKQLKHLHLQYNNVIQHIINSTKSASCPAFPILESLVVDCLMNLEKICHGQLAAGSFKELRILRVKNCNKLMNLFSISMARGLLQLQEIQLISCDNIEAIVLGETDEDEAIQFNQLWSLKLINLPHLRSFCSKKEDPLEFQARQASDPAFQEILSEGKLDTSLSLFNRMVSFPNLTSLTVSNCDNLKYLFTTSSVQSLSQLKKLEISGCQLVEEIIVTKEFVEEGSRDKILIFPKLDTLSLWRLPNLIGFCTDYSVEFQSLKELSLGSCDALMTFVSNAPWTSLMVKTQAQKVNVETNCESLFNEMVTFSSLESIHLSYMRNLKSVWHNELAPDSFCKLKSLDIFSCEGLVTLFSPNVLQRFQRLENLKVFCGSLQYIYQLPEKLENVVAAFELRNLRLSHLSSLKHIWNKDPQGVFTFQNLQAVEVSDCEVLKNVFPASIARNLLLLEKLYIYDCGVLEEIVGKANAEEVEPASYFEFPQLASLHLYDLRELRSFYPGKHASKLPKLKVLDVSGCCKVRKLASEISSYQEETDGFQQPLLLVEKISPNLEELKLENEDIRRMQLGHQLPIERFSRLKVLTLLELEDKSLLFLSGFLKKFYCLEKLMVIRGSMEDLFSHKGLVREAELVQLKNLELSYVYDLKHIWKDDSQLVSSPHYLETLKIDSCESLIYIAPSSSSLKNLMTLDVSFCKSLKNLITTLTAKTMVQLTKMEIYGCYEMTEIVSNDGNQSKDYVIAFEKLKILKLQKLCGLTSFCSGNHNFSFPSLEEVTVIECFQLKTFSHGDSSTPKLRGIRLNSQKEQQYWAGSLNATIASQFTLTEWDGTYFALSLYPELKEKWHTELQGRFFRNITSMHVDGYALSSEVLISSNLLRYLDKLKELDVTDCDSIKVVFDLEELFVDEGHFGLLPQLSRLHLRKLPVLSCIWNKNPQGILDFSTLKSLYVENCSILKHPFTWYKGMCLVHLEEIKITNCNMMEAIIKDMEAEAAVAANDIVFPSLKSLFLQSLPKLSSFYSGSGNLKCPSLKKINIYECPNIKPKTDEGMAQRLAKEELDIPVSPFFSHTVLPSLEELSLDNKSIIVILQSDLTSDFFYKIRVIQLRFFPNKSFLSLFVGLFTRLGNLEELRVTESSLQDLFHFDGLGDDQENSQLHGPFVAPSSVKLKSCPNLISLAPSSVPFHNLTTLEVRECNGLINLITPATAKSMVQLATLRVYSCNMLMQIVAGEEDGTSDEIVFSKLKTLKLVDLDNFTSFCNSSRHSFNFPSLEHVHVEHCPNFMVFCSGKDLNTPQLDRVRVTLYGRDSHWAGDLNTTVQQLYMKMVGFEKLRKWKLSQFPRLKEKWPDQFSLETLYTSRTLVVDEYAWTSSFAISPNILQSLRLFDVLVVKKCDSVEEVLDLEGLTDVGLMRSIKKLKLIELPNLRHVWSKDPLGILSYENLTSLQVHDCSNLTWIFTPSMALGLVKLRVLEVKKCTLVEEIITGERDDKILQDNAIFTSLRSISLECLPSLSRFCSATDVLKCPSLKKIDAVDCPKMELFASTFPSEQDSSMILERNEERLSIGPLLCRKIATPSLEELKVEWSTLKKIWPEIFPAAFLCKLKVIELTCFCGEQALLPSDFLQVLTVLENLVLSDSSFEELILEEILTESPAKLKKLKLLKLPNLKHLMEQGSRQASIFECVEKLKVMECGRLEVLVPSSVSLGNLIALEVSECHGLINLITCSTARSLLRLKRMVIKDCEMIQQIVATEADGVEDEIHFSQLTYLELHGLSHLTSFCSSNCAFNFPCLEEVIIRECTKMEVFAHGAVSTSNLWRVQTGEQKYEWEWEGSLNGTIVALFVETSAEECS